MAKHGKERRDMAVDPYINTNATQPAMTGTAMPVANACVPEQACAARTPVRASAHRRAACAARTGRRGATRAHTPNPMIATVTASNTAI